MDESYYMQFTLQESIFFKASLLYLLNIHVKNQILGCTLGCM